MPLQGTFDKFNTLQLLNAIHLAKKSGVLNIYAVAEDTLLDSLPADPQVQAVFQEGKLILADAASLENSLVAILRKAGKLNDQQVTLVQQNSAGKTEKALALMLINANYLNHTAIVQSVRQHILDIIFDLLTWDHGAFNFDEAAALPTDRVTVPIDLDPVIAECKQRMAEIDFLREQVPNLDLKIKLSPRKGATTQLNTEQWQVIGMVNGKATLREIAHANHMTDSALRRVVVELRDLGLVEIIS